MKRIIGVLCGILLLGATVRSEEGTMRVSKPAVRDEILAVVESQLAAFRAGEVEKAFGYAAAGLRQQMPSSAFARMVQQNYPEIWQSTGAEFNVVRDDGVRAALVVHVFAKGGDATYDYIVVKEAAGWRIGGVLRREVRKAGQI